jgi:Xaa-Pro aminopeptidase
MTKFRVSKIAKEFLKDISEGLLVTSMTNCRYLSGFTGSNGYLLVTRFKTVLFTDSRYVRQAEIQCPWVDVEMISTSYRSLLDVVSKIGIDMLYLEPDHISLSDYQMLKATLEETVCLRIDKKHVIEQRRAVKDCQEITQLIKAVEFADLAMRKAIQFIKPEVREVEVSNLIKSHLIDLGSEGPAFDTIVGAGLNAALPHHMADDTIIQDTDHVVIDMGAIHKGYRSDITRTIKVSNSDSIDGRFDEIYEIVLQAQLSAINAAEPGIHASSLDRIARDVISKYGLGQYFTHGLGHGIGLDVHEKPMLVKSSTDIINIGSVFTVEPGIYMPDWGGVRIEDMLLMEESGPLVLTNTPK